MNLSHVVTGQKSALQCCRNRVDQPLWMRQDCTKVLEVRINRCRLVRIELDSVECLRLGAHEQVHRPVVITFHKFRAVWIHVDIVGWLIILSVEYSTAPPVLPKQLQHVISSSWSQ